MTMHCYTKTYGPSQGLSKLRQINKLLAMFQCYDIFTLEYCIGFMKRGWYKAIARLYKHPHPITQGELNKTITECMGPVCSSHNYILILEAYKQSCRGFKRGCYFDKERLELLTKRIMPWALIGVTPTPLNTRGTLTYRKRRYLCVRKEGRSPTKHTDSHQLPTWQIYKIQCCVSASEFWVSFDTLCVRTYVHNYFEARHNIF